MEQGIIFTRNEKNQKSTAFRAKNMLFSKAPLCSIALIKIRFVTTNYTPKKNLAPRKIYSSPVCMINSRKHSFSSS